jgi:uncharacterized protein YbbK (DUF523 family)/uncharacterized protein YbgA (DUF1722 family)
MSDATSDTARWRSHDLAVRVGVSACLLGTRVRYDGGHKHDAFVEGELGRFVQLVPVCPEVELGMAVPRPPIQIVQPGGTRRDDAQQLREVESGRDHTGAMNRFAARRARDLASESLCGFVLKSASPTCGVEGVKVWPSGGGRPARRGRGFFARALMDRDPLLPVEEDARLADPTRRELFIERIFACHRLRTLYAERFGAVDLVAFHRAHAIQLASHSARHARDLDEMVARLSGRPSAPFRSAYSQGFSQALRQTATRRRHGSALRQILEHLRDRLDGAARGELRAAIDDYCSLRGPRVVPITLMREHALRLEDDYLVSQVYLDPHPAEQALQKLG